jgi:hypothetical protein
MFIILNKIFVLAAQLNKWTATNKTTKHMLQILFDYKKWGGYIFGLVCDFEVPKYLT